MIRYKVRNLMKLYNKSNSDMAKILGIHYNAFNNKIHRDSFSPKDLILIGKETGTRLAFIDKDNKPIIIFDETDIQEYQKSKD